MPLRLLSPVEGIQSLLHVESRVAGCLVEGSGSADMREARTGGTGLDWRLTPFQVSNQLPVRAHMRASLLRLVKAMVRRYVTAHPTAHPATSSSYPHSGSTARPRRTTSDPFGCGLIENHLLSHIALIRGAEPASQTASTGCARSLG